MKTPSHWEVSEEALWADCKVFKVFRERNRHPQDGREGDFFVAHAPAWVTCVCVTEDGNFLVEQQYRYGVRDLSWELPGGVVEANEDPIDAGPREVLEETGYAGDAPILLGKLSANPAIFNNFCSIILIKNCRKVAETSLDENEEILVREVSPEELLAMARDGRVHHSIMVAAIGEVFLKCPELFGK